MFNLPELTDWATEDAAEFDALAAELDARWRDAGLSLPALLAPTCEVVDTSDPAPWWLVELDNDRPRRYPAVPLRELWTELCPVSLTAWTREHAEALRAELDAAEPVDPAWTITTNVDGDDLSDPETDARAEAPPCDDRPTSSRWRRFWGSHGVRTAGLALGAAAVAVMVGAVVVGYWSAWVSG